MSDVPDLHGNRTDLDSDLPGENFKNSKTKVEIADFPLCAEEMVRSEGAGIQDKGEITQGPLDLSTYHGYTLCCPGQTTGASTSTCSVVVGTIKTEPTDTYPTFQGENSKVLNRSSEIDLETESANFYPKQGCVGTDSEHHEDNPAPVVVKQEVLDTDDREALLLTYQYNVDGQEDTGTCNSSEDSKPALGLHRPDTGSASLNDQCLMQNRAGEGSGISQRAVPTGLYYNTGHGHFVTSDGMEGGDAGQPIHAAIKQEERRNTALDFPSTLPGVGLSDGHDGQEQANSADSVSDSDSANDSDSDIVSDSVSDYVTDVSSTGGIAIAATSAYGEEALRGPQDPEDLNPSSQLHSPYRTHTGSKRSHKEERPHTCDICSRTFKKINNLNEHKRAHDRANRFMCKFCSKPFARSAHLLIHERTHTGEKPYTCSICSRAFARLHNLQTHERIHTGEKPYSCDICKKSFSQSSNLKHHRLSHKGEKPYMCKFCSKKFTRFAHLKVHERVHTGEKPYTCNICSQTFARLTNFQRHERKHTGEKPYMCDICSKAFTESGTLKEHKRIHNGEKPYTCKFCEKAFSRSGHCKAHERTHTGEKPYTCKICNKSFTLSSHLKTHDRTHNGEKPFKCNICNRAFAQLSTLKQHENRLHTGEKPYTCNICSKAFAVLIFLKQHERIHNKEKKL